ncbi:MAG: hypothetical protein ACI9EW_002418, partial [Cellvibrionaceae bacterium]
MKYYLVIIPLFFLSLTACISQAPAVIENDGSLAITSTAKAVVPALKINQDNNGPNQPVVIEGNGFPANQVIVIYYADSETNFGP